MLTKKLAQDTKKRRGKNDKFQNAPAPLAKIMDFLLIWVFLPILIFEELSYPGLLVFIAIALARRYCKELEVKELEYKQKIEMFKADARRLSPRKFEYFVAEVFKDIGYEDVVVTPQSGDHGKDIIAYKGDKKTIVECKLYKEGIHVGKPLLRSFLGAICADKADLGFFVTTSDYTAPAYKFAEENDIQLINGDKLFEMVIKCKEGLEKSRVVSIKQRIKEWVIKLIPRPYS